MGRVKKEAVKNGGFENKKLLNVENPERGFGSKKLLNVGKTKRAFGSKKHLNVGNLKETLEVRSF